MAKKKFKDNKPTMFKLVCPKCFYRQDNPLSSDEDYGCSPSVVWGIDPSIYLICPLCQKTLDYEANEDLPLIVNISPDSQEVEKGETATFIPINYSGGVPPYRFILQFFDVDTWKNSGGWKKQPLLEVKNVKETDEGDYRVKIWDKEGVQAVSDNTANLIVVVVSLYVEISPIYQTVDQGDDAYFYAVNYSGGTPPYDFRLQFFKDGSWTNVSGWQMEVEFELKNVKNKDQGQYRLRIRDDVGATGISDNEATLEVN